MPCEVDVGIASGETKSAASLWGGEFAGFDVAAVSFPGWMRHVVLPFRVEELWAVLA